VLPPIVVNGVHYRVLRFEGEAGGMRFLLRNDAGELFGVYGRNAQNPALAAAPLELKFTVDNRFGGSISSTRRRAGWRCG
jgi:hypothetical protein